MPVYPFEIWRNNEEEVCLQAGYYVGVLWLIKQQKYVYIAPKMNSREASVEIDFLKMLLEIYTADIEEKHTRDLIKSIGRNPKLQ